MRKLGGWRPGSISEKIRQNYSIAASEHNDHDCIIIYDETWRTVSTFGEVRNYRASQFFHYSEASYQMDNLLNRYLNGETIILVMAMDDEITDTLINDMKVHGIWPEFLYRNGLAPTFILSAQEIH